MKRTNYVLRHAKAQAFSGYDSPGAVLRAAAEFSDDNRDQVFSVHLNWTPESGYGANVIWEDLVDVAQS